LETTVGPRCCVKCAAPCLVEIFSFKFQLGAVGYLLPQPDISFEPSVSPVHLTLPLRTPTGAVRAPWCAIFAILFFLCYQLLPFFHTVVCLHSLRANRRVANMDYSPFFAQTPQPYQFVGMPPTPTYSSEEKIVSDPLTLNLSRKKFHVWSNRRSTRPTLCVSKVTQMPIRTLSTLQSSPNPTISVTLSYQPATQT
jgi:hypothetical protein